MKFEDVPVLILCGGLGTRLRSVLSDSPKILAPIGDKLFIDFLFSELKKQGVRKVILALGYKAEKVQTYLNAKSYEGMNISIVVEGTPLGTAGAIRNVIAQFSELPNRLIVMNGDTFISVNLKHFLNECSANKAEIGIVATQVDDCRRYGELVLSEQSRVLSFSEKQSNNTCRGSINASPSKGWINGGVYLFGSSALSLLKNDTTASLETSFIPGVLKDLFVFSFKNSSAFLDIGTPESFEYANEHSKSFERLML